MFLIHKKLEGQASRQGFNWTTDEYTKFQLVILVWRMKFYFRIRRKKAFGGFDKTFKRVIVEFSMLDVFKNGFCRLDKKLDLWENFDADVYRIGDVVYRLEDLPESYIVALSKMYPSNPRYQKMLNLRSV